MLQARSAAQPAPLFTVCVSTEKHKPFPGKDIRCCFSVATLVLKFDPTGSQVSHDFIERVRTNTTISHPAPGAKGNKATAQKTTQGKEPAFPSPECVSQWWDKV